MSRARITLDRDFTIGDVPRRLLWSLRGYMGRCVYTGIYEPGHTEADDNGFRQDVLKLVKELGATVIRYPGGNFVSGYDWEDGIGPGRTGRGGLTAPGTPLRPMPSASTSSWTGPARRAPRSWKPSTWAPGEWMPPGPSWSMPTTPAAPVFRTCGPERTQGSLQHQTVVPRQRNGRALADRPQNGGGVWPACAGGSQGDAPG